MAVDAATVWEVRTTGASTNGGGFVTGASGVDYSQQDAAQKTDTDLATVSDTVVSSAGTPFDANDVGNIIQITAGTGFATGWYEILSESSGDVTLDRAVGTHPLTGGTFYLGGAYDIQGANVGAFFESHVAGNITWIEAGTYTITAAWSVAADGTVDDVIRVVGYNAARDDRPVGTDRPLIACGANGTTWDNYWWIENIDFTTTSTSNPRVDVGGVFWNCKCVQSTGNRRAFSAGTNSVRFLFCEATAATTGSAIYGGGFTGHIVEMCYLHDAGHGMAFGKSWNARENVIESCGNGVNSTAGGNSVIQGNTIDNCSIAGIYGVGSRNLVMNNQITHCLLGANADGTSPPSTWDFNNWHGNTADVSGIAKGDNATADDPGYPAGGRGGVPNFLLDSGAQGNGRAISTDEGLAGTDSSVSQGAWQAAAGGGSGGLLVNPGMAGGLRG